MDKFIKEKKVMCSNKAIYYPSHQTDFKIKATTFKHITEIGFKRCS